MHKLDLRQIILFLCSLDPDSGLRLMLQLALAAPVPEEKLSLLQQKINSDISLVDLLKDDLLINILKADGNIGSAEENMLYEAIEQMGLVAPTNMTGAEYLLSELSNKIIEELDGNENIYLLFEDAD